MAGHLIPVVADCNHANPVDFAKMAKAGIVGVIHKASQNVADPAYADRRTAAHAVGLEWGAYHFCTGHPTRAQVDLFFYSAKPDERTVMVLDFEENPASQMSLAQAVDFLGIADEKLGRPVDIYSGNRIKDLIPKAGPHARALLAKRRLWICQYGPTAKLVDADHKPLPWTKYWLWQCWADGYGPHPIPHVPGLEANADLSVFDGDAAELRATWTPASPVVA